MSVGQITIAQAAKGTWTSLWKGTLWVGTMILTCYAVGIEWNWRALVLCVSASFFDFILHPSRDAVGGAKE